MSPAQEEQTGAEEHRKVIQEYGALPASHPLQKYVSDVGAQLTAHTERSDVTYKFFVLDSPVVNAFALPGGYVYVTRGLLAQANSEAELASVLGHEIGHITARHSAERYSRGVVTTLGAAVLAAAVNSQQAAQAASIGSDLYLKSYSRGQESQADELGIRYMHRAGYDVGAMAHFLENLGAQDDLDARLAGRNGDGFSYFSTHPRTQDRVTQAYNLAGQYQKNAQNVSRDRYLTAVDGIIYGDSPEQGFVRGQNFYHPGMGFTFGVPSGFRMENQPAQVVAVSQTGAAIIFDAAANPSRLSPGTYIAQSWVKGKQLGNLENITVNGKPAATASFPAQVNGRNATIRIVAIAWDAGKFFRFQMAIPQGADPRLVDDMKRVTYSLRAMTPQEIRDMQPMKLDIVTARSGDTDRTLAARMPFADYQLERFRVLNGLHGNAQVRAGEKYKIVVE